MATMDEISLKRRLSDRGLKATEGWLDACINFFKSSNEQFTAKELEDFVFDQWLLADLRELKLATFPPNLAEKRKIVLTGHYTCQIESVLDIGHSAYSQYQKISKKDTTNLEVDTETDKFSAKWEPKSSRTMMLYICDGVQEIRALEFRPVSILNTNIIPGTKAIVKGPVLCRRGIIMLEEGKISLLGGEVDKYIIPNAYENILATCLELPLNPDPYNLGANTGDEQRLAGPQNGDVSPRRTNQGENRHAPGANPQCPRVDLPNAPTQRAPPQRIQPEPPQSPNRQYQLIEDDFIDDEALLNIDLDFETEFLNQHSAPAFGTTTSNDGPSRGQTEPNRQGEPHRGQAEPSTSSHRREKTSSNANQNHEPVFRREQNSRPYARGTSSNEVRPDPKSKQNSITSYLTGKTSSNTKQNSKPGQSQRNIPLEESTSSTPWDGAEQSKSNKNIPQRARSPKYLMEEDDEDILLVADFMDSGVSTIGDSVAPTVHVNPSVPSTSHIKPKGGDVHGQNNDFIDNDVCLLDEGLDDEALMRLETAQMENRSGTSSPIDHASHPENISSFPYLYIAQVIENPSSTSQWKRVRVKAIIVKVTEKISVSNGEWRLGVEITDGSGKIPVRMSSEIVSDLFGLTPAELSARKKAAAQDPNKKAELKKHFERGQTKLLQIDSIFEIEISSNQPPLVVNIYELTPEHEMELKKRVLPE